MSLTLETLMKLNKDILAVMVLGYKEKFDSTLSAINDELKELNTSFCELETDVAITYSVREKSTQQLILVERQCCANEQYPRRECMGISGIPDSVQNDDLEDCVLEIFNECDTPLYSANIEACHRSKLKAGPKKVIIKLSKRKDVFNILQGKKKLKSADIN